MEELNNQNHLDKEAILKLSYDMRENLRPKAKGILKEGQELVFNTPVEVSFEEGATVTALNWEGKLYLQNVEDMTKIGVPAYLPHELQQIYDIINRKEYQIIGSEK